MQTATKPSIIETEGTVIIRLIIAAALILALAAPALADEFTARVVSVHDGDTFNFEHEHLNVVIKGTCRMLGYNAPELRGEEKPLGNQATDKLTQLLGGQTVNVTIEHNDKYGRALCDVYLQDGTHVNAVMRAWLTEIGYTGVGKYDRLEPTRNHIAAPIANEGSHE